ncbi:hypothetical protein, partial [Hymenobacter terricola]|uniref:hypothetical protein n=1 Tax=Hymenobacter terricola TaxID=2819236 RepID=UPI001CF48143
MKEVARVINLVGNARGNDKLALLKKYADTPGLKEILKFIYNPYCKTGISTAKLSKAMHNWPVGVGARRDITWEAMIAHFKKNQTGAGHDVALAREFIWNYECFQGPEAKALAI